LRLSLVKTSDKYNYRKSNWQIIKNYM
jgi:hypothetical protein